MDRNEILHWLKEEDAERLEALWARADRARRENVGDAVHLRGLVEISNYCVRSCAYCGLRVGNSGVERYRMSMEEVLECARTAERFGYGTLVVQSGEDPGIGADWVSDLVRRVKTETPLAVTLSLGERGDEELAAWRKAGADRYLLRFETSNPNLYESIHPSLPGRRSDRIALLRRIRDLGYEVGSGAMIGIPGQTYEDLADDIEMFRDLDLDMIGVGPFIPHPGTPLGLAAADGAGCEADQVPNSELMTYKVVALTRIVCPLTNIPSTTALATLNLAEGRELGLSRGANVVMPNLTPVEYRSLYEIYPAKACLFETGEECHACLSRRIASIGRTPGQGPGGSLNIQLRRDRGEVSRPKDERSSEAG
ncbi:[FeFe] hydrogenase H-cluster radical SAM maturase HydE [Candidatus Sumerlaeota bacterium]|nr:[FeFe] hydrogenase H-cluster radical SAM maturase HydE [Candidatus Sumerlaeota bacterium]